MEDVLDFVLAWGTSLPPEVVSVFVLFFSLAALSLFHKIFGLTGLYLYNALAICLANIQILHITHYSFFSSPTPLGTVLFTTTFFANTLMTNLYGAKAARRGILLSFLAYSFFAFSMILSLLHVPVIGEGGEAQDASARPDAFLLQAQKNYEAIKCLFLPSLRILGASLFAFAASQLTSVATFQRLKKGTKGHLLGLRHGASIFLSSFVDHFLFSYLAFFLFVTPKPSLTMLWMGYGLDSFILRYVVIGVCVLIPYLKNVFFHSKKV
ncbi:hypothetical protein AGMMS49949_05000 [Alphaproteobacteria bacterium]|nr:hypothetical protein AGMMS49949_05000 [Alphaproteobacteria bacterium]GHS97397.1 hypothetical protein AGMMS50296_4340 [Alphaproteobacteria bacterium]